MAHNLLDLMEDDDLTDEGPCEFCGACFPFELLIEHQSGCRPDLLHFAHEKTSNLPLKTSDLKMETQKIKLEAQKTSYDIVRDVSSRVDLQTKNIPVLSSQTRTVQQSLKKVIDPIQDASVVLEKFCHISSSEEKNLKEMEMKLEQVTIGDHTMEEISGSKIMAYGTKNEEVEESEMQSFRFPSLPLLDNADQKKSKLFESELLSDDESGESLEEFWKRAEIALYQRKMKRR